MDKYVVGQQVRVIGSEINPLVGHIVTIKEPRLYREKVMVYDKIEPMYAYGITLSKEDKIIVQLAVNERYVLQEHHLEPIGDLNNVVSWSECGWKPREEFLHILRAEQKELEE